MFHPCGLLGRLKINVMQVDSIDHSHVAKQAFTASRKSTNITFCPRNSWNKIAPFRMRGCSISTIILPFKILFPIWARKYRSCHPNPRPPFYPWHKYRPGAIDPGRSQIWAGHRLVLLPKQLKPRRDIRWFVFTGRGINTNSRKRRSSLKTVRQWE